MMATRMSNMCSKNLFDFLLTNEYLFDIIKIEQLFEERVQIDPTSVKGELMKKSKSNYKKRKMYMGTMMTIYLVLFSLATFSGFAKQTKAEVDSHKVLLFVDRVKVEEGDTLWSIAEEHHSEYYNSTWEYVEAIKECNGLSGDMIKAGSYLMVPYTELVGDH